MGEKGWSIAMVPGLEPKERRAGIAGGISQFGKAGVAWFPFKERVSRTAPNGWAHSVPEKSAFSGIAGRRCHVSPAGVV